MSDIKPWQIVLIVVALGVLAFSGWRMTRGGVVEGPSGQMTVDVLTGQLYLIKKGKAKGIMYPAKNPDTGNRTLYPVAQVDGTDAWELYGPANDSITKEVREQSKVLGKDLNIRVLENDPIVFVLKK